MIAIEALRMRWYSRSVSVCAGATVIESPVCTPIGSKFSIEQMMTTLSALSRITSISNSFQPSEALLDQDLGVHREREPARDDLLELLDVVGDAAAGAAQREGRPDHARQADLGQHAARVLHVVRDARARALRGRSRRIAARKRSRSSALRITSAWAPIISTPSRSSTPESYSAERRVQARSGRPAWAAARPGAPARGSSPPPRA